MSELNLPACPLCRAPGALSLQTRNVETLTYTWYECAACGSVLLAVGDDRWAYQKVGVGEHATLLKRPLTTAELWGLVAPANDRTIERSVVPPPAPETHLPAPRPLAPSPEWGSSSSLLTAGGVPGRIQEKDMIWPASEAPRAEEAAARAVEPPSVPTPQPSAAPPSERSNDRTAAVTGTDVPTSQRSRIPQTFVIAAGILALCMILGLVALAASQLL